MDNTLARSSGIHSVKYNDIDDGGRDQNIVHTIDWNSNAWLEPNDDSSSYLLDFQPVELFVLQDLDSNSVDDSEHSSSRSLALLPFVQKGNSSSRHVGGNQVDHESHRPKPPLCEYHINLELE